MILHTVALACLSLYSFAMCTNTPLAIAQQNSATQTHENQAIPNVSDQNSNYSYSVADLKKIRTIATVGCAIAPLAQLTNLQNGGNLAAFANHESDSLLPLTFKPGLRTSTVMSTMIELINSALEEQTLASDLMMSLNALATMPETCPTKDIKALKLVCNIFERISEHIILKLSKKIAPNSRIKRRILRAASNATFSILLEILAERGYQAAGGIAPQSFDQDGYNKALYKIIAESNGERYRIDKSKFYKPTLFNHSATDILLYIAMSFVLHLGKELAGEVLLINAADGATYTAESTPALDVTVNINTNNSALTEPVVIFNDDSSGEEAE